MPTGLGISPKGRKAFVRRETPNDFDAYLSSSSEGSDEALSVGNMHFGIDHSLFSDSDSDTYELEFPTVPKFGHILASQPPNRLLAPQKSQKGTKLFLDAMSFDEQKKAQKTSKEALAALCNDEYQEAVALLQTSLSIHPTNYAKALLHECREVLGHDFEGPQPHFFHWNMYVEQLHVLQQKHFGIVPLRYLNELRDHFLLPLLSRHSELVDPFDHAVVKKNGSSNRKAPQKYRHNKRRSKSSHSGAPSSRRHGKHTL